MRTNAILLAVLFCAIPVLANPVAMSGYSVELFAIVDNPFHLSLDANGNLFAGRTDPNAPIHRISRDGLVEEFGGPINDPDAVIVDIAGTVATLGPGSVLVAGALSDGTTLNSRITEISPDGMTTRSLADGTLPALNNPQGMAFAGGQLLWANNDQTSVPRTDTVGSYDGTALGVFGQVDVLTGLADLAVAADGRVFVSDSGQSKVQVLSAAGTLLDPEFFVGPVGAIAFDQTGKSGTDLFIAVAGKIVRVDLLSGGSQDFVTGFDSSPSGLDFGPDGCLYASEISQDKIWRICAQMQIDANRLYFAQFGNGVAGEITLKSDIVAPNPSATETASGTARFFKANGTPFATDVEGEGTTSSVEFTVLPLDSTTISTTGQGDFGTGTAVISSDMPLGGVIRFDISAPVGIGSGIAGVPASQVVSGFVTPVRRVAGSINTGLAIRNVGFQEVNLNLSLRGEDGVEIPSGSAVRTITGDGQLVDFINGLFPDADTGDLVGSLVVTSDGMIAPTAIEQGTHPGEFTTLPVTPLE